MINRALQRFPTATSHTCADQPHLPCGACREGSARLQAQQEHTDKLKELDRSIDAQARLHVRRMVTLAFRFGYRACLIDCVPRPEITTVEKIDDRAKLFLGEDYIEI